MTYLGQTALAVAYTSEVIYIYYTTDCEQGETNFDDNESLAYFQRILRKKGIIDMYKKGEVDFSKVTTFNLDDDFVISDGREIDLHDFHLPRLLENRNLALGRYAHFIAPISFL